MKQIFSTIWEFIKGDRQTLLASRFIWELVAVAIGIALTWLISQLTGQQSLQAVALYVAGKLKGIMP